MDPSASTVQLASIPKKVLLEVTARTTASAVLRASGRTVKDISRGSGMQQRRFTLLSKVTNVSVPLQQCARTVSRASGLMCQHRSRRPNARTVSPVSGLMS